MADDSTSIPQRRLTDSAYSTWLALTFSAIMALGGTAAFTFHVYDSIRNELGRISLLEPTLLAHIEADSQLQRICQERVDYLERKVDALRSAVEKRAK